MYDLLPWARLGGFTSPNKGLDAGVYPDDVSRRSATILAHAQTIAFDLSDLQLPHFGSSPDQGMQAALRDFLRDPRRIGATAERLEREWQRTRSSGG
jgi:alpha-glucoside transport system substrate-binding protein